MFDTEGIMQHAFGSAFMDQTATPWLRPAISSMTSVQNAHPDMHANHTSCALLEDYHLHYRQCCKQRVHGVIPLSLTDSQAASMANQDEAVPQFFNICKAKPMICICQQGWCTSPPS